MPKTSVTIRLFDSDTRKSPVTFHSFECFSSNVLQFRKMMNMNAQVFFIVIHKTLSGSRGIQTKRSVQRFVLADVDIKRCRQGLREEP